MIELRDTMYAGHNLWILKPNDCNRGRGLVLFNKLDDLKRLINENQHLDTTTDSSLVKSDFFVIQKYIERPLLINERKFDIRLWVLVTHDLDCYLFEEGYIRTSSYKYSCDAESIGNLLVHLTNNAI